MIPFLKPFKKRGVIIVDASKRNLGRVPVQIAHELVNTKHASVIHNSPVIIGLREAGKIVKADGAKITGNPLKNIISVASLFAAKSSRIEALNSIMFTIANGRLCIMATNLDAHFTGYTEPGKRYTFAHDKGVDGVCINARHLAKILSCPDEHTNIQIRGSGTPGIQFGSFFVEGFLPGGQFPDIQIPKKGDRVYPCTIADITNKLTFVGRAVSTNKYRSALCGLYLDLEKLKLVGADGNRLHMVPMEGVSQETKKPSNTNETPSMKGVIVPSPLLRIGKLLTGKVRIYENNDPNRGIYQNVIFDVHLPGCMDCTATYRALEGTYPQYVDVVPKGFASRFIAKAKDVIPVLHKALIANTTDAASKPITVEFNKGGLRITTKVYERIRFQGIVNGEYSGQPYYGNINGNFLFDAAQTMPGDSIEVLLQGKNDEAWIIRNQSGFTASIMPLGLENGN